MKPTLAAVLFLASAASTPAASEPALINGQYDGIIFSNGAKQGSTKFSLTASNKIIGAYIFGSPDARETGKLSRCKLKDTMMSSRWSDAYGIGTLNVKFSNNFCSFEGVWYAKCDRNNTNRHNPLVGKRNNCSGLSS